MSDLLKNKKIAVLMTNGFEEIEFTEPRKALEEQGAIVDIISLKPGMIKSWDHSNWGKSYMVDKTVYEINSEDYDGLLLPGGVLNPDALRQNSNAVTFAKDFLKNGKPVAAICHGSQLLIETEELPGRKMTSYQSIKTDLENAGANWVDMEVVVDNGLVTSRKPNDIPAFNEKMIEIFKAGVPVE